MGFIPITFEENHNNRMRRQRRLVAPLRLLIHHVGRDYRRGRLQEISH